MKYHALFVIFENAAIFEIVLQIIGGTLWVKAVKLTEQLYRVSKEK